ncbi:hypothetical protein SODG_004974 [Sodalis praecaptivus]|uniref:hypothetical protein n=1 Tax=Sodalis praecaptivus TaxID=1239307 RepID=UPI0027ED8BB8|nr:hypothetical protein [Sodalis praecaptivus]CAJ0996355.1 hypothetical protein NVIRENTERO_02354 [Sodalis praecaptivus]
MKSKTARQIIDELDLPDDKQVSFMQLYDAGFELMDEMLKANESSAVRVYLHLIKNNGSQQWDNRYRTEFNYVRSGDFSYDFVPGAQRTEAIRPFDNSSPQPFRG